MSVVVPLDDAADTPEAGGKARTLARARRAGLPVLNGFVVLPSAARWSALQYHF